MKNIAIVCGGNSGEYDISIKSAAVAAQHLDKNKYTGYLIIIKGSQWYWEDKDGAQYFINKDDFSLQTNNKKVVFHGVFNAIHGTPGEDGKLQGYLDMLNIPYTSCNTTTAALTFDKFFCNRFVNSYGIQTANALSFLKGEAFDENEIVKTLGLPLFVKPAQSGSSVGVSKVIKIEQLKDAIQTALNVDDRVIVEEAVNGREIACGMIQKKNELLVFPLTEIVSKKEFFDYEAKYTEGMAREITPAAINTEAETDIKTLSAFLYRQMNCKGFVRFDYILTPDNLYFLEVNSIPGISEASILPQQAKAFGLSIGELFDIAIEQMFF